MAALQEKQRLRVIFHSFVIRSRKGYGEVEEKESVQQSLLRGSLIEAPGRLDKRHGDRA
jgi:hypothetical protein